MDSTMAIPSYYLRGGCRYFILKLSIQTLVNRAR